ncbi:MAG: ribonuclease P protein component [bacterium]
MAAPFRAHFLRREHDFDAIFQNGRKTYYEGLMLVTATGTEPHPRLGIMINRKRGKAHDRNAFRRRAKAWFWRHRADIRPGADFVLVATTPVKVIPRQALYDRLRELFTRSGAAASL